MKIELTTFWPCAENRFHQVSIQSLRVWGRRIGRVLSRVTANVAEALIKPTRVNRSRLCLFRDHPTLNPNQIWFAGKVWPEIDPDSKELFDFLMVKRNNWIAAEQFVSLAKLKHWVLELLQIGNRILRFQILLESAIEDEDYDKAEKVKQDISLLIGRREFIEVVFESDRFWESVRMKEGGEEAQRETLVTTPNAKAFNSDNGEIQSALSTIKSGKRPPSRKCRQSPMTPIKHPSVEIVPYNSGVGNSDLDAFFEKLALKYNALRDVIMERDCEVVSRIESMGIIEVFGPRIWFCVADSNWRLREVAGKAVVEYTQSEFVRKFSGKTEKLFVSCCEFAKLLCADKVTQIYIEGLLLLTNTLGEHVCGRDVTQALFRRFTFEFVPLLIRKVSELNHRTKDVSLQSLIEYCRHPHNRLEDVIKELLEIPPSQNVDCSFESNNVSKIEKLKERIAIAKLEIFMRLFEEFPTKKELFWAGLKLLVLPSLKHPDLKVRTLASNACVVFSKTDFKKTMELVCEFETMNKHLMEELKDRLGKSEVFTADKSNGFSLKKTQKHKDNFSVKDSLQKSKIEKQSVRSGHKSGLHENRLELSDKSKYMNSTRLFNSTRSKFKLVNEQTVAE